MKKIMLLLFVGLSQFVFAQAGTVKEASKSVDDKNQYAPPVNFEQVNTARVQSAPSADDETIYTLTESPAEFEGGKDKCLQFVARRVVYPALARENGVAGKTAVRFVVEKNGSVSHIECINVSTNSGDLLEAYKRKVKKTEGTVEAYQKMLENCNNLLKEESVKGFKLLPKWKPATQNGVVVRSYITLPLNFKLEG